MPKALLSEKEAAEFLGVNARTVMRWTRSGKLGTVDFPAANGTKLIRRYALKDLEAFVQRHRKRSIAEKADEILKSSCVARHASSVKNLLTLDPRHSTLDDSRRFER